MRVTVTGASGNLGSALLRRLRGEASRGHHVTGVSRRPPDAGLADAWARVDLAAPGAKPELVRTLSGADAVVHLAWKLQPNRNRDELRATNVDGTRRLLSAAVEAGVPHVVVITSVGAYAPGPKDRRVDESWSTAGIPTSWYSRQKAEVERLLDRFEADHPQVTVTRVRPALVFQAAAGSEIARLFLGSLVPHRLVGRVPLPALPLSRELVFQSVHADDVAGAVTTLLQARAGGAYNVAADPELTPRDLADAVRARFVVPVPTRALRAAADLSWRLHLQPSDPGWIDLATQVPLMSTDRLRALGWAPGRTGRAALLELVGAIRAGRGDDRNPPLARHGESPGSP
jgi:UDP-glucose 4-epimerase